MNLFVYGTLCHLPLLRVVLAGQAYETKSAKLPNHQVFWVKDQPFPVIVGGQGSDVAAHGLLICGLSDEAMDRINHYEGGFGYHLMPHKFQLNDGTSVEGSAYFPAKNQWVVGADWSLQDWVDQWGAMSIEAAHEVMSYFRERAADAIAQRFPMIRARAASRVRGAKNAAPTTLRSTFGSQDVLVETESYPYSNFFVMGEQDLNFRLFDQSLSETVNRAALIGGDAVILLPYDPKRDRVMLVEQFRMGPHMRRDPHPWTIEPIAGRVDAGETPEQAAHREAREEAGLTINHLIELPHHYPSPGCSSEYFYLYLAICDLPDTTSKIGGEVSEHEDIKSHIIDFAHLMNLVRIGEINNGPLLLCAYWLTANKETVQNSC